MKKELLRKPVESHLDLRPQPDKKRKREPAQQQPGVDGKLKHALNQCAKEDDVDKAIALFDEANKQDKPFNIHMFNVFLYLLSNHGRTDHFFKVYEQLNLRNLKPDETTLASFAKACVQDGNVDRAWEAIQAFAAEGSIIRLRCYSIVLKAFCDDARTDEALEVFRRLKEHDVNPSEEEFSNLLRAIGSQPALQDKGFELMHEMADYVPACSPTLTQVLRNWFSNHSWQVLVDTKVDNNGVCEANRGQLRSFELSEADQVLFCDGVSKLCNPRHAESFEEFKAWVADVASHQGPFEVVIDGANVGMHKQNFVNGGFSMVQVRNVVKHFEDAGKRTLLVMHQRHMDRELQKQDPVIRKACHDLKSTLYSPARGTNDDWYWLYAAVACGSSAYVVSNDQMRDHTFQLLSPKYFARWRERHQVYFTLQGSKIRPEFTYPLEYSYRIQSSLDGNAWYFPITDVVNKPHKDGRDSSEDTADEDEQPSEEKWMCAWKSS